MRDENPNFAPFSVFGTVPAIISASAEHRPTNRRRNLEMTVFTSFSSRLAAAATAFALSLVLFTNTVTTPAQAPVANLASAYVGAVA
jgi:hypothetical protein